MSTLDRPERRTLPPLVAGQQLDQPTFHERYEAMPPETRAELVGGVVYMPSPLGYDHGGTDEDVALWLGLYRRSAPRVGGAANATIILGDHCEPQPDHLFRIPEERGGQTRIVDDYVQGPPELVVEVARSSRNFDLRDKKNDYERAGAREYLVIALDPDEIYWFVRRDGSFVTLPPGPDGWFRSEVFPGLWLDPKALFAGDLNGLIAALEQGLATPEHAAFVARLSGGPA